MIYDLSKLRLQLYPKTIFVYIMNELDNNQQVNVVFKYF